MSQETKLLFVKPSRNQEDLSVLTLNEQRKFEFEIYMASPSQLTEEKRLDNLIQFNLVKDADLIVHDNSSQITETKHFYCIEVSQPTYNQLVGTFPDIPLHREAQYRTKQLDAFKIISVIGCYQYRHYLQDAQGNNYPSNDTGSKIFSNPNSTHQARLFFERTANAHFENRQGLTIDIEEKEFSVGEPLALDTDYDSDGSGFPVR